MVSFISTSAVLSSKAIEGRSLRKQRINAARLACLKVEFSEEYDESDYSESEARDIFDSLN